VREVDTCVALHPYHYRLVNPEASLQTIKNAVQSEEMDVDVPAGANKFDFPRFADLVTYFFTVHHTLPASFGGGGNLIAGKLPPKPFASVLAFVKRIAIWEALGQQQLDIKIDEDWDRNVDTITDTDEAARTQVENFLQQQDASVVTTLLDVAWGGMLYDGEGVDTIKNTWNELAVLVPPSIVERYTGNLPAAWKLLTVPNAETRRVAATAVGLLGSHHAVSEATLAKLVEDLVAGIEGKKSGAIGAFAILLSRLKMRGRLACISSDLIQTGVRGIATALMDSRDAALAETAIEAVGELAVMTVISEDTIEVDKVQKSLLEKAKRGHQKAVQTLGYLAFLYPEDSPKTDAITAEIIKLGENGGVEMSFVAGEALANASAGWGSSAVRRGRKMAGVEWAGGRRGGVRKLLDQLLKRAQEAGGGGKRRTTVVGLLSAFEFCSQDEAAKERLGDAQQAFRAFLTDRDGTLFNSPSRSRISDSRLQTSFRKPLPAVSRPSTVSRMRRRSRILFAHSYLPSLGRRSRRYRFPATHSSLSPVSCLPGTVRAWDRMEISWSVSLSN